LTQNRPCCQARAMTFLAAFRCDGMVGWPPGGS
jgi:hypothetical protein